MLLLNRKRPLRVMEYKIFKYKKCLFNDMPSIFFYQLLRHYFSSQLVVNNWCNKGCGVFYPLVHIKEPLVSIRKCSSYSGECRFPLWLYEWSFIICPTPYNREQNVLSVSLNKTFSSFQVLDKMFQVA